MPDSRGLLGFEAHNATIVATKDLSRDPKEGEEPQERQFVFQSD